MVQQLEFSEVNVGILAVMKDTIFFEKRQEASYHIGEAICDLKTLAVEIV